METPRLRKTRIVCVSDTHNSRVKLPTGDVLIHAGDLTNQGSYSELSKAVAWLEEADFEAKIVIAGNHDITLDQDFYALHGTQFHNQNLESSSRCCALLESSASITYLRHESKTIRLWSPDGPHTEFSVFGSPFSPRYGSWAFYYDPPPEDGIDGSVRKWDDVAQESDIVVTHTPARGLCDDTDELRAKGCEALRRRLSVVRPRLAVCGHIHDGRGAKRVRWDFHGSGTDDIVSWEDPGVGNNKQSLIDLTGRKGPPLANDGAVNGANYSPAEGGRQETCVVNAAIMKSRYPHIGGRELNKPIVVDMNLPVWGE